MPKFSLAHLCAAGLLMAAMVVPGFVRAEQNCYGVVKSQIYARQIPDVVWEAGRVMEYITQYIEVDGDPFAYFCIHGGYCYQATKSV